MARLVGPSTPDRHLHKRNGFYTYKRRVPSSVAGFDSRSPIIRIALGTSDIGEARLKRDAYERADDLFWASLCEGGDQAAAEARYKSTLARATALGFTYRHLPSILLEESGSAILARLRAVQDIKPASAEETAILGGISLPRASVRRALEVYINEISASDLVLKSAGQRKLWTQTKTRAVDTFEKVCGAMDIEDIKREDARKFYKWWLEKIAPHPKDGKPTHSADSGNRQIGNMRVLYRSYFEHMGQQDFSNPFEGLAFADKRSNTRPPFPDGWIETRILAPGALAGLNDEARGIVCALVETGCRPSEIINLTANQIMLDDPIPHIKVETRYDVDDPREIKTRSSIREVPLVGISLEAMKKFPKGFPRYKDKENTFSAAANKYLLENGLRPTKRHVVYSLRHSFERRAKDAKLDTEMRMMLMGHLIDRPNYGEGGVT